jgi:ParB family chromosome partitioning protein
MGVGTSGWGVIPSPSPRATLDENIVRHELTELERAEMEARRREIYETLYPLARYGARRNIARVERGGLNQGDDGGEDLDDTVSPRYESASVNDDENVDLPPPYTQYAAERGGTSDRTIQRRLRIAEKLYPEVRDYIRGTPLADDQRGLLRLTRLEDPELQLLAARLIVEEGVTDRTSAGVSSTYPRPRGATLAGIAGVSFQGRTGYPVLRETQLSRTRVLPLLVW